MERKLWKNFILSGNFDITVCIQAPFVSTTRAFFLVRSTLDPTRSSYEVVFRGSLAEPPGHLLEG